MNRILTIAAALILVARAHAQKQIVAYVPNWIDVAKYARKIDYAKLTHINVAFENPINAYGSLSQHKPVFGLIAKAHEHGVKVLVSIGGGSASEAKGMRARYFYLIATPTRRIAFAKRLANYVVNHHFDGVDVDLEGPAININYGPFIAELSKALKARGKLLTAAVSQGYGGDKIPNTTLADFDFINIMAYDATGPWAPDAPGQHSSLDYAKSNVQYWLGRGLPKSKAVLGVPFYGYGFGKTYRKGDYSYSEIVGAYPGAESADQAGETIWYNGQPTIAAKARYALDQGLGGIMIWHLNADATDQRALLPVIYGALNP